MGSSSDLASRLDFNRGLIFQEEIRQRFKSPVHHPLPSPNGSFFLLASFRRFLFRLTEDSVGLALQSCLGGRALDFHVKFLSNNHFRFSVFSKDVGFQVYKLRRVITSHFDVYFHLWNNGTPHWEREKRAWEIEQEKEWTLVLSKAAKKEAKKKENLKHVHFVKPVVQSPPQKNQTSTEHPPYFWLIFQSCCSCQPSWSIVFWTFSLSAARVRWQQRTNKEHTIICGGIRYPRFEFKLKISGSVFPLFGLGPYSAFLFLQDQMHSLP
jgi:hypothetical protein